VQQRDAIKVLNLGGLARIEADHSGGLATYHAAQTENILTGGDDSWSSRIVSPRT
jgi:hypothetical protein